MKYKGRIALGLLVIVLLIAVVITVYPRKAEAAGDSKYEFIIYGTYSNPYYRLVRVTDCKIWDTSNSVMTATPTLWTDTDTALTENTYIVGFPVDIDSSLPAGEYDFLLYDAASPASTDSLEVGKRIHWNGTKLLGLPIDL